MDNREFTLSDLFGLAFKWIWMIIIGMVVVGAAAFYFSKFCVTPMYSSTSKYYVQTKMQQQQATQAADSNSVLNDQRSFVYAQTVVSGYIEVLDTYNFANELSDYLAGEIKDGDSGEKVAKLKELGAPSKKYSGKALKKMVTFSTKEEAVTFSSQVLCDNPDDAQKIAEYIEAIIPEYLDKKAPGAGAISIIDDALASNGAVNNKVVMNTILGILIGAVIAFLLAFVIDINDTRVKDEKELSEISALPVIGSIPDCTVSSTTPGTYQSVYDAEISKKK